MIKSKKKNTDTALGLVRLELRASKRKIQQLAGKYYLPSPKEDLYTFIAHSPEITKKEIPYKYSCIIDKIENSDYTKTVKEYMIQTVIYFSHHKNCKNLLDDLHLTRQKWNAILENFNDLGCSPIPIPRTFDFIHIQVSMTGMHWNPLLNENHKKRHETHSLCFMSFTP